MADDRPNVGILLDTLTVAGVQKIAINETKSLPAAGVDASILAVDAIPDSDFYDGVEILSLVDSLPEPVQTAPFPVFDYFKPAHLLGAYLTIPYERRLRRRLLEYDVIVAHNSIAGIAAKQIKKTLGVPYVLYIHDPFFWIAETVYESGLIKAAAQFVERGVVENADAVALQSSFHERRLADAYGVSPQILYPGYDSDAARPSAPSVENGKTDQILLLTRWSRNRIDFEWVADILERNPDTSVVMAGSWPNEEDRTAFEAQLHAAGAAHRVEITGYVPESELESLYGESSFYLHPAREAFGMGALEACHFGTIPIMRAGSGVCDLFFEYGLEELAVSAKGEMARRVAEIRDGDAAATRDAVRRIAAKYTWRAHAESLAALVGEVHNG